MATGHPSLLKLTFELQRSLETCKTCYQVALVESDYLSEYGPPCGDPLQYEMQIRKMCGQKKNELTINKICDDRIKEIEIESDG